MTKQLMARKEIKDIADLGEEIPSGLRFGIIVTIALFWVEVIRGILTDIFSAFNFSSNILVDFIMAILVTLLAYLFLLSFRKIVNWIRSTGEK